MKGVKIEDKYIVLSNPDVKVRVKTKTRDSVAYKQHVGEDYNELLTVWIVGAYACAIMFMLFIWVMIATLTTPISFRGSIWLSPSDIGGHISNQQYVMQLIGLPLHPTYIGFIKKKTDFFFSMRLFHMRRAANQTYLKLTEDGILLRDDKVVASYAPFARGAPQRKGIDKNTGISSLPHKIPPNNVLLDGEMTSYTASHRAKFVPHNCSIVITGPYLSRMRTFSNKRCTFKFQKDGNFVVYDTYGDSVWDTKTYDRSKFPDPSKLELRLLVNHGLCIRYGDNLCVKEIA